MRSVRLFPQCTHAICLSHLTLANAESNFFTVFLVISHIQSINRGDIQKKKKNIENCLSTKIGLIQYGQCNLYPVENNSNNNRHKSNGNKTKLLLSNHIAVDVESKFNLNSTILPIQFQ